jgi:Tfp pilus assembly protein PilE
LHILDIRYIIVGVFIYIAYPTYHNKYEEIF